MRSDGYHLIDAEMVTVDLADELTFSEGDGLVIIDEAGAGLAVVADEQNLVRRALRLVGRSAHVVLRKRIPAGGGLGGGSADAAAVLRWAGVTDPLVAAQLGADVPFCLRGGRARVTGIGELLTSLPPLARRFTLVTPPFGCATPQVYRTWDRMGGPQCEPNDLEPAALEVEPRLAGFRDALEAATGVRAVLAGSGSTWFVPGDYPGPGHRVVATTP